VSVSSKHKNLLASSAKSFEEAIQDMLSDIVLVVQREGNLIRKLRRCSRVTFLLLETIYLFCLNRTIDGCIFAASTGIDGAYVKSLFRDNIEKRYN